MVEFGVLQFLPQRASIGELVHQRREPPRKTYRLPNPLERCDRNFVDFSRVSSVRPTQPARQVAPSLHAGFKPLAPVDGALWLHSRQKQAAKTHWFGHKAAQWGNAFFD